jgi:glyoxylase-like metal-dependent hydrolase (beta-lactamase superfamily II)
LFEECNLTLIVSGSDALLVDTGYRSAEATRVLDYLSRNRLRLQGIVITHHHPDHDGNLAMFQTNRQPVYDFGNIGDERFLAVGKKTIRLFPTPGHHPIGDISVSVEEDGILIAGDILFSCLPPMLGYGARPAVLRTTIESIAERHDRWIVPGHGRVMTGDAITAMSQSYMDRIDRRVRAVVESLGTEDDLSGIKLSECMDRMEWMIEEPSVDLHRQNKLELFASMKKRLEQAVHTDGQSYIEEKKKEERR